MTRNLLTIGVSLVVAAASACVGGDPPIDTSARPVEDDVPLRAFAQPEIPDDGPDGCELVVATTGACSVACDSVAVVENHVPVGTCATFTCPLTNGDTLNIGGCNL